MAVWVVRAGKYGEQEEFALAWDYAVIDWRKLGSLLQFRTQGELLNAMAGGYPYEMPKTHNKWTEETWGFAREIAPGDLFILPLKKRDGRQVGRMRQDGIIAVGKFIGDYKHVADAPNGTEHRRKVIWIRRNIPRVGLDDDISASLENTQRTVFQPRFARAEERIRKIA